MKNKLIIPICLIPLFFLFSCSNTEESNPPDKDCCIIQDVTTIKDTITEDSLISDIEESDAQNDGGLIDTNTDENKWDTYNPDAGIDDTNTTDTITDIGDEGGSDSGNNDEIYGNCNVYFQGKLLPPSPSENEFNTIVPLNFKAFPVDPCITPSSGRIIWVARDGSINGTGTKEDPINNLNKALEVASSGDAIVIRGGTYYEGGDGEYRALPITKSNLIISGYPGEEVVIEPSGNDINYGITISGSNIAIRNLTLRNFVYSIAIEEAGLRNLVFAGIKIYASNASWTEGIVVYPEGGEDGILFRGVEIFGAGLGISCNAGPCRNWRLEWVNIRGVPGGGESGADNFAIESGDNILLYKVEASLASGDGIDCKGTNIAVFDSYVHDVDRNAIKLWHNGDIVNSITYKSGADAAIVFDGGGDYRILNSIISFHNYRNNLNGYVMTVAYDTQEAGNLIIDNSIFTYNNGGIYVCERFNIQMHNNLFYEIKDNLILEYGQNKYYLQDGASKLPGSGNIVNTDPQLSDPQNGDMSFSGGPCCNGGYSSPNMPPHDMLGNDRVQGSAVDLGPIEYCK